MLPHDWEAKDVAGSAEIPRLSVPSHSGGCRDIFSRTQAC